VASRVFSTSSSVVSSTRSLSQAPPAGLRAKCRYAGAKVRLGLLDNPGAFCSASRTISSASLACASYVFPVSPGLEQCLLRVFSIVRVVLELPRPARSPRSRSSFLCAEGFLKLDGDHIHEGVDLDDVRTRG